MSNEQYRIPLPVRILGLGGLAATGIALLDSALDHSWYFRIPEISEAPLYEKTWNYDLLQGHVTSNFSARDNPFADPISLLDPEKYTYKRILTLSAMVASYGSFFSRNNKNKLLMVASASGSVLALDQLIAAYDTLSVANGLQWGGATATATAFTANRALRVKHKYDQARNT